MKFNIPVYANSVSGCPAVSKHALYLTGCSTLSTDFSNAADLTPSASSGILYATLADATVGATYNFCLKVEAGDLSITVPSLEFKICSSTSVTSSEEVTKEQIVMVGAADMRFKIKEYT